MSACRGIRSDERHEAWGLLSARYLQETSRRVSAKALNRFAIAGCAARADRTFSPHSCTEAFWRLPDDWGVHLNQGVAMMTGKISALHRRMIEDMKARGLLAGGQRAHIRSCKRFAAFLGHSSETATCDDIRRFQIHLAEEAVGIGTRNAVMSGVKFPFRVTLRRLDLAEEIYHLNEPQQAPVILNVNEVKRLLAVARPLKARSAGATLRRSGMAGPTFAAMRLQAGRPRCCSASPMAPACAPARSCDSRSAISTATR